MYVHQKSDAGYLISVVVGNAIDEEKKQTNKYEYCSYTRKKDVYLI